MAGVALLILLISAARPLSAHEIGTTQVDVLFGADGTYTVDIGTDPEALALKLLAAQGRPAPPRLSAATRDRIIREAAVLFISKTDLRFDDHRVVPSFSYQPPSSPQPAARCAIHLSGRVPPGSKTLSWSYGLTFSSYAFSSRHASDANPQRQWIEADGVSKPIVLKAIAPPATRGEIALRYLQLGFTHILPKGVDHILFVLGIFLLSTRLRSVLAQVTTFTIAHSITLGLTIYGLVSLSPRIVEPMIALSICYVAIENLFVSELKPWRLALVFGFGLLHGMGFAGVLREMGLPRSEFLTALITFNVGVELGQLAVISIAFVLISSWARKRPWYRERVVIPASALIALTGLYWTVQRVFF